MKKQQLTFFAYIVMLLGTVSSLHAQAVYAAERTTRAQAGGGILILSPDYTNTYIKGVSGWGDFDFRRWVGVEASVHIGSIITPADIAEDSYMVGPRVMYHRHRITAYGKLLVGRATITNQDYNLSSSYNAYAFGGGLEYLLKRKINVRVVDIEVQKWPNFEPNTLSPVAYTVGASYVFF